MYTPIASLRWLRRWAVAHFLATSRPPRLRHVSLARVLRAGGAAADAAALATSTAAHYEDELQRLGGDVESVSLRVRKLLLTAALTAARS